MYRRKEENTNTRNTSMKQQLFYRMKRICFGWYIGALVALEVI